MLSVEDTFHKFINKYNNLNMKLASGGLMDVKGISDVDISLFHNDYEHLDHIFKNFSKKMDNKKPRVIYTTVYLGREINIYVTNDKKLYTRALKHRDIELKLNKFENILTLAINYKLIGNKTEPSYCLALDIKTNDPYEYLLSSQKKILDIASKRNEILEKIKKKLQ